MFFAGRPELELPPAPATRQLSALRWFVVLAFSTNVFLVLGILLLNAVHGLAWAVMLPMLIVPLSVLGVSFEIYSSERRRRDRDWWTASRVQSQHPALWHLYCAANVIDGGLPIQ